MTAMRLFMSALLLLAVAGPVRAESYHTCAGFIDSLPATIGTQGTWCLRQDLSTALSSGFAIEVTTNNVTIDCNGFKIGGLAAGPESTAYGIYAHSRQNIALRRCTVRGFYVGTYLFGSGMLVEDSRFDNNLWKGISVFGESNRVLNNLVTDTGGGSNVAWPIAIHASADVIGNSIYGMSGDSALANNSATGIDIYAGRGHIVRDNNIGGLLLKGAGTNVGIHVEDATATLVQHNNMSRTGASTGTGIWNEGLNAFCNDNTVYNFAMPLNGCTASSGNQSLP